MAKVRKKHDYSREINLKMIDAVIFDMDGVITDTANTHAKAWKQLFDEYLEQRAKRLGEPFQPFDIDADYRQYVDGKPRYDGVKSFLESRGISLPYGNSKDDREQDTVCGLGNRKNEYFLKTLKGDSAKAFPSTIQLIQRLKANGIRTAVISASRNCTEILDATGVRELFDEKVDGINSDELGLKGKPDPDIFLEAAKRLGVKPERAAIIEDAIAGVEAGRKGKFKLVIGVDRAGYGDTLKKKGADVVVRDLSELTIKQGDDSIDPEAVEDVWTLSYTGFEPDREGLRETLCTLGNGYFATRGAAPESHADDIHYPGTYVAGCYNRLKSEVDSHVIENESLVNVPNWLPLTFRLQNGNWFDVREVELLDYRQKLNLHEGTLTRHIYFKDEMGRKTKVFQRRFVHMSDEHLASLEMTIMPENWSGTLDIRSALDGEVANTGVKRYRKLNNNHLTPVESEAINDETIYLQVQTNQSRIRIAEAARTRLLQNGKVIPVERRVTNKPGYISQDFSVHMEQGQAITIEKVVSLFTSRDRALSESGIETCKKVERAVDFDSLLQSHILSWDRLWTRCQFSTKDSRRAALLLNLHIFHLLQTVSQNTIDMDVGVPPRGLHGEAYRGLIMWDELFIFPFLNLRIPDITRALLQYRYRRLPEARWAAKQAGHDGAMYPWQSGSDGREEAQTLHLNPLSGRWVPDNSSLQRHINIAVAYNVWLYYQVTADTDFLSFYGAEMLVEIARFWACVAQYNPALDRYEIRKVMGPDEYHDAYPDAEEPGINNNSYTNVMAVWVLCRTLEALDIIPYDRREALFRKVALRQEELKRWEDISRKMRVIFHDDGIISQFEGYDQLQEFDWEAYQRKYGNIERLDRILESEGDTTNRYKLSKQADALMLFYLLSADELHSIFSRLGYEFKHETIPHNIEYYMQRTAHGSTLSRIVNSWVLARSKRELSWRLFKEALETDVSDIQGGTTPEGIHLGAIAGTVDLIQRCYAGVETHGGRLHLNPRLPEDLKEIQFDIRYRHHWINLHITDKQLKVSSRPYDVAPIHLCFDHEVVELKPGDTIERKYA